jgi:type VI secretion system secreted protein VgrG
MTRTVLRTQSHKGEGYNEVRFEDEANQEQVFLYAQKDLDMVVNNIRRTEITADDHLSIGKSQFSKVTESRHTQVGQDEGTSIGREHHLQVGSNFFHKVVGAVKRSFGGGMMTQIDGSSQTSISGSQQSIIGHDLQVSVSNQSYQKATSIVLEAGSDLSIVGPGGFILIDTAGVTISGSTVKINDGGSPGSGSVPSAVAPDAPVTPTAPSPADRR